MFLFRTHFDAVVRAPRLREDHFIALAVSAIQDIQATITYISPSGLIATAAGNSNLQLTVRKSAGGYSLYGAAIKDSIAEWGKAEALVLAFRFAMGKLEQVLVVEELDYRYSVIAPHFSVDGDQLAEGIFTPPAKPRALVLDLFWPQPGYFVTPFIVWANILVMLGLWAAGEDIMDPIRSDLMRCGANFAPLSIGREPWRLLSATFLHSGPLHLLSNMAVLMYAGAFVEPLLGRSRFALGYLLCGIAGSVVGALWHPLVLSVGASGAVFGVIGMLVALLTKNVVPRTVRMRLLMLVVYYALYGLLAGLRPGIDNAAHLGGLLGGLMIGALARVTESRG